MTELEALEADHEAMTQECMMAGAGRSDLELQIELADEAQAARMFDRFFPGHAELAPLFAERNAVRDCISVHYVEGDQLGCVAGWISED